jgi:hypothetical protein
VGIRFEGSTAFVVNTISPRTRLWVAGGLLGLAACSIMMMWLGAGWLFWVGTAGLGLAAMLSPVAILPDARVVIDAAAQQVTMAKRYPWQGAEKVQVLPFSAVYSIGVNRVGDGYGGYDYNAVLRLNGGRNVELWSLRAGRRKDRELARFFETDPELAALQKLTGFRREDRLSGGWFG